MGRPAPAAVLRMHHHHGSIHLPQAKPGALLGHLVREEATTAVTQCGLLMMATGHCAGRDGGGACAEGGRG